MAESVGVGEKVAREESLGEVEVEGEARGE